MDFQMSLLWNNMSVLGFILNLLRETTLNFYLRRNFSAYKFEEILSSLEECNVKRECHRVNFR